MSTIPRRSPRGTAFTPARVLGLLDDPSAFDVHLTFKVEEEVYHRPSRRSCHRPVEPRLVPQLEQAVLSDVVALVCPECWLDHVPSDPTSWMGLNSVVSDLVFIEDDRPVKERYLYVWRDSVEADVFDLEGLCTQTSSSSSVAKVASWCEDLLSRRRAELVHVDAAVRSEAARLPYARDHVLRRLLMGTGPGVVMDWDPAIREDCERYADQWMSPLYEAWDTVMNLSGLTPELLLSTLQKSYTLPVPEVARRPQLETETFREYVQAVTFEHYLRLSQELLAGAQAGLDAALGSMVHVLALPLRDIGSMPHPELVTAYEVMVRDEHRVLVGPVEVLRSALGKLVSPEMCVPLPDPATLETMLGLWDPDSDGPLSSLAGASQAAGCVHA